MPGTGAVVSCGTTRVRPPGRTRLFPRQPRGVRITAGSTVAPTSGHGRHRFALQVHSPPAAAAAVSPCPRLSEDVCAGGTCSRSWVSLLLIVGLAVRFVKRSAAIFGGEPSQPLHAHFHLFVSGGGVVEAEGLAGLLFVGEEGIARYHRHLVHLHRLPGRSGACPRRPAAGTTRTVRPERGRR